MVQDAKKYPVVFDILAEAICKKIKEQNIPFDPEKLKGIVASLMNDYLGTIIDVQSDVLLSPGYIIAMEIEARKLLKKDVANGIKMQPAHLSEILAGTRTVTPTIAYNLEMFFGIDAAFWLRVQNGYTLAKLKKADTH